jgi:hypothetical protein
MQGLVTAVAPYQHLYVTLLGFLTREDFSVVKRREGDKLLELCFRMIPYKKLKVITKYLHSTISDVLVGLNSIPSYIIYGTKE